MRIRFRTAFVFATSAIFVLCTRHIHAQAALLTEEPYGFFGEVAPTGHNAIYFEHICAETPTHLRPCQPDEPGVVIARYQGIAGYDWIAIPLIPYLYSVEEESQIPQHVDRSTVERLRDNYHEAHLLTLGDDLPPGSIFQGGWTELVGVAYERRIYAFRFNTTEAQDNAFIARMNSSPNHSHFNFLYNNCSDFARVMLNSYFPHTFHRSVFPDAGMTTPKQLTWQLERYATKHPDVHLAVFEIPQVPGYRRHSHSNKSVAESLSTTIYAVPIFFANPYIGGGIFADYLIRNRFRLVPRNVQVLSSTDLSALTSPPSTPQTSGSAGIQASGAAAVNHTDLRIDQAAYSGQKEMKATHE